MRLFKEMFEKKIPKKNYYIVIIGSLLTIALTFLIRMIYLNYKENATKDSIFNNESITQINIDDLDYALDEISSGILYVSYTGNYEVSVAEKKLYKEIKKKNLLDKIIYLDVTNTSDYLSLLKEKYTNISNEITNAPMLIYIEDGEAKEAMSSELKVIDDVVLDKLIEKYEIE